MDEQNNVPQPEEGNAAVQGNQAVPEAAPTQPTEPVTAQPAVEPTQAMPAATQPAAPQQGVPQGAPQGAPVNPGMPQQPAAYPPPANAYQQPPKATGALVCGILAIVFCWMPIVGIILGIVAIVQAGKYIKAGGIDGSGKAGKICGIVGIVLSGIMIVINCILVFLAVQALDDYDTTTIVETYSSTPASSSSSYSAISDASPEDEAAVYAVVDPELAKIKNQDPAMIASIAKVMEDSLNDILDVEDISLADLQVDPTALATAMTKGFEYEQYYVDASGDEAEANYHVTCKDMSSVMSEFYDQLMELVSGDVSQYGSTEAAYAAIGQALMSSVDATPLSEGELFDVELNKVGGNWVIDQDSWDDEMEYFFG